MSDQIGKAPKRRKVNPTYLNSILMISLVLILVGLVGIISLYTSAASTSLKESVRLQAYLKDQVNEVEMLQLRKKLETEAFVAQLDYVTQDEARELFNQWFDEDTRDILGEYNPFPAAYSIGLNAGWVQQDSLTAIEERLSRYREIKYVKIPAAVVNGLDDDFQKLAWIGLGLGLLVLFITITLIDKTIRLAMYSNRFLIRSMQLVGATRYFIIQPYLVRGILNGLFAALIAVAALVGLIALSEQTRIQINLMDESFKFALLFGGIILMGILISWWSTQRAVSKYLKMKLDELY
jgi:cell division transport system permease protein